MSRLCGQAFELLYKESAIREDKGPYELPEQKTFPYIYDLVAKADQLVAAAITADRIMMIDEDGLRRLEIPARVTPFGPLHVSHEIPGMVVIARHPPEFDGKYYGFVLAPISGSQRPDQ